MTLKTFKRLQIGIAIIIAITIGQSIIRNNYIIPLVIVILGTLVMLFARRYVKEIIADERDYLNAGRAATLSLQIYAWVAVIVMFIFYSQRASNIAYDAIGQTLAYSTCFLMLLYSILFRYFNKMTPKK